jgi:serine/threonine protein kinase
MHETAEFHAWIEGLSAMPEPADSPHIARLLKFDEVCEEFEAAWRQGLAPRVEDYLARLPGPERPALERELAAIVAAYAQPKGSRTVDECIRSLDESGLMAAEEARAWMDSLPADQRPTDGCSLTIELQAQGKLTEFQAEAINRGEEQRLVLGNYVVLERLARSRMGEIYKARHQRMDRLVALKLLPPAANDLPEAVKRFQRGILAAARLSHPNIITAHDAGEAQGMQFLVMEYVEGWDLERVVQQQGPLPVDTAVDYLAQAARGLEYAHSRHVLHRDVKPANLLLDKAGQVRILDLGLARLAGPAGAADDSLTGSSEVMGTLDYMAPEQALDPRLADVRSDVYSLGCTLYYLLTGRVPFPAGSVTKKILAHREEPVPSLRAERPDVPEWLDEVFRRMLAKQPEARQQTMTEVLAALGQVGLPQTATPTLPSVCAGSLPETVSFQHAPVETSPEQAGTREARQSRLAREGVPQGRSALCQQEAGADRGVRWWRRLDLRHRWTLAAVLGLAFAVLVSTIAFKLLPREGAKGSIESPRAADPPTPAPPAGDLDRRVAQDLLNRGARVGVVAQTTAPAGAADRQAAPSWLPWEGEVNVQKAAELPAGPFRLVAIDLPTAPTPEMARSWAPLERLRILQFRKFLGSKEMGEALSQLPGLRSLSLFESYCTDADIECLGALAQLECFDAQRTAATDRSVRTIGRLANLKALRLSDTGVTDAGLAPLGALKSLESLRMTGNQIDGSGLAALAGCKSLRELNLHKCERLGDSALPIIAEIRSIEHLNLEFTGVTSEGLLHLTKLSKLRRLCLTGMRVDDLAVPHLARLEHLMWLELGGTKITAEAIAKLQAALPSCKFAADPQGRAELAPSAAMRRIYELGGLARVAVAGKEVEAWLTPGARDDQVVAVEICRKRDWTSADSELLSNFSNLVHLNLWATAFPEGDLPKLALLTRLEFLNLGGIAGEGLPRVTFRGLSAIKSLAGLKELHLQNCRRNGGSLEPLTAFKELKILSLWRTDVRDEDLTYLRRLGNLQHLDVGETRVGDAGVRHLESLGGLNRLILKRSQITGAALDVVGRMRSLKHVDLTGTAVTGEAVARLKTALPECEVVVGP